MDPREYLGLVLGALLVALGLTGNWWIKSWSADPAEACNGLVPYQHGDWVRCQDDDGHDTRCRVSLQVIGDDTTPAVRDELAAKRCSPDAIKSVIAAIRCEEPSRPDRQEATGSVTEAEAPRELISWESSGLAQSCLQEQAAGHEELAAAAHMWATRHAKTKEIEVDLDAMCETLAGDQWRPYAPPGAIDACARLRAMATKAEAWAETKKNKPDDPNPARMCDDVLGLPPTQQPPK